MALSSQYCAKLAILASTLASSAALAFFNPEYVPDQDIAAMHGPVQFYAVYSDKTGYFWDPKYVNDICAFDALAIEFGFGTQMFRTSGTWGHAFSEDLYGKITADFLAQDPDILFDTGKVTTWLGQWSLGADLRYMTHCQQGVHSVHLAIQYITSETESFPNVLVLDAGQLNLRRVAGAREYGVQVGARVRPWYSGYFDIDMSYDSLQNKLNYEPDNNAKGLGFGLAMHQNISDCLVLIASGVNRRYFYEWYGGLQYIPYSKPGSFLELQAGYAVDGGDGIFGHQNRVIAGIAYSWGGDPYGPPRTYRDPLNRGLRQQLLNYTNVPVVRPPQIFVARDQALVSIVP